MAERRLPNQCDAADGISDPAVANFWCEKTHSTPASSDRTLVWPLNRFSTIGLACRPVVHERPDDNVIPYRCRGFSDVWFLQDGRKRLWLYRHLAMLRWSLVIVFVWFGAEKFTNYAAEGIAPLIANSPIVSWLRFFGVQGEARIIGTIELTTAAVLSVGAFQATLSALGSAMSCATYLVTMSFFLTTPGVSEAGSGGFPVISTVPGQFLLKDLILFASSVVVLVASLQRRT